MAKIIIPTPLRRFTDNAPSIDTEQTNVQGAIEDLSKTYPSLSPHLLDAEGKLKSFIRIYVGDEDIKSLDNGNTPISADSVVSLIPAIAGGLN